MLQVRPPHPGCLRCRPPLSSAGRRQLPDLVGDLQKLLDAAEIPGPYVLVGSSGGGYIVAGYAEENPDQVVGMVLVDTAAPWLIADPPPEVVKYTDPDNPENIERRDFLQVEKDAWGLDDGSGTSP